MTKVLSLGFLCLLLLVIISINSYINTQSVQNNEQLELADDTEKEDKKETNLELDVDDFIPVLTVYYYDTRIFTDLSKDEPSYWINYCIHPNPPPPQLLYA